MVIKEHMVILLFFPHSTMEEQGQDFFDDNFITETQEPEYETQVETTVEELLISCVEVRPALWDSRLPLKDRGKNIRDKFWTEIFMEFGENPEFSIEFLQKKWRHLRDTYVRLKGEYVPSGSASKKKRKWEFFDLLTFLNDTIGFRPTVTNVTVTKPSPTPSCSSSMSVEETSKGTKKRNDVHEAIVNALEKVNTPTIYPSPVLEIDDVNPICKRISDMLKEMPQKEKTLLEIKLIQCAYDGSKSYLH